MADNVGYTPGVGSTVAADDIGGVLHQRIKLALGDDGVNDGDVSDANPMPVVWASGTVSISGSVAVTGTFWQATQPVSGTFWQGTQPVSGPLTDAQLRAVAVPVSGAFFQATQPVSGTFWQATQPVSGTFWQATQPVSGAFFQATQPVSVASLPLPSGAATEATLAALPGLASTFKTRSDTYTGAASGVTVDCSASPVQVFSVSVKGTGGAATTWDVRVEGSLDNTNFTTILTHTNTTGDGLILFSGAVLTPSLYIRTRCAGLVLGPASNIVVTLLGRV